MSGFAPIYLLKPLLLGFFLTGICMLQHCKSADKDVSVAAGTQTKGKVSVLSDSFYIPQLDRYRRIWVYLPPGYGESDKRYPVLYMQDGQNLFADSSSFSGEWGIDESLDSLFTAGKTSGIIVVGIENGADKRLLEYAPWPNSRHGGGEGEAYARFLVKTLKPSIDSSYRTLPGQEQTAIAGSSLGGLIGLYTGFKYPHIFGKIGVFSPAFWFNPELYTWIEQQPAQKPQRIYMVASALESEEMLPDQERMHELLLKHKHPSTELSINSTADGAHKEWYWRREFPAAFLWLFEER